MQQRPDFDISAAVAVAKSKLTIPSPAPGQPALVMFSGLPGTGKSTLAQTLASRLPAVVIESDRVRQTLFSPPSYAVDESRRVHTICHILIGWCLRHYYHVIYDATNLYEYHRKLIYRLADRSRAQLVVIELTASETVIRERLAPRNQVEPTGRDGEDYSEADWNIYMRMRRQAENIQHEHVTVDTSDNDLERALQDVLKAMKGN